MLLVGQRVSVARLLRSLDNGAIVVMNLSLWQANYAKLARITSLTASRLATKSL